MSQYGRWTIPAVPSVALLSPEAVAIYITLIWMAALLLLVERAIRKEEDEEDE